MESKTIYEFNYIKKYFKFDCEYYKYISNINAYNNDFEKEFIKKRFNDISKLSKDCYNWEISKLYELDIDKENEIILNSKNDTALDNMLDVISQIEKDFLLYINIYKKDKNRNLMEFDENDIENNIFIKKLIDSDAKMPHVYRYFDNLWDEDLFVSVKN